MICICICLEQHAPAFGSLIAVARLPFSSRQWPRDKGSFLHIRFEKVDEHRREDLGLRLGEEARIPAKRGGAVKASAVTRARKRAFDQSSTCLPTLQLRSFVHAHSAVPRSLAYGMRGWFADSLTRSFTPRPRKRCTRWLHR